MHPRRSPLHSAALAAATAAAAGLGWWWWTSTAPEPPRRTTETEVAEAEAESAPVPSRSPAPSEVLTDDAMPIENRLPDTGEILYRDSGVMTSDTVFDYDGPVSAGTDLVLQFTCVGSGAIRIEIVLPDNTNIYHHECGPSDVESIEFGATSTGYSSVRITAPDAYFVGIAYQLVLRR